MAQDTTDNTIWVQADAYKWIQYNARPSGIINLNDKLKSVNIYRCNTTVSYFDIENKSEIVFESTDSDGLHAVRSYKGNDRQVYTINKGFLRNIEQNNENTKEKIYFNNDGFITSEIYKEENYTRTIERDSKGVVSVIEIKKETWYDSVTLKFEFKDSKIVHYSYFDGDFSVRYNITGQNVHLIVTDVNSELEYPFDELGFFKSSEELEMFRFGNAEFNEIPDSAFLINSEYESFFGDLLK